MVMSKDPMVMAMHETSQSNEEKRFYGEDRET